MSGSESKLKMKPGRLLWGLPVFVFGLNLAQAQEAADYSLCKLDREVRTLRVERKDTAGNCQTVYNKYGKDQSVGEAQHLSSCYSILERVKSNLVEAGWRCRAIKDSSSTDLSAKAGVE